MKKHTEKTSLKIVRNTKTIFKTYAYSRKNIKKVEENNME